MPEIFAKLADEELWRQFHPRTEMIITKKGRSMFPKLEFHVSGLAPKSYYTFEIRLERVDQKRYKYDSGEWRETAIDEPGNREHTVHHLDGARLGEHWMSTTIAFSALKITNNINETRATHIVLKSMCKYRPVLKVVERENSGQIIPFRHTGFEKEFRFDYTQFVAVTSYQNKEITQLKVRHNKYASAFRTAETRKRVATPLSDEEKPPCAKMANIELPKALTPPDENMAPLDAPYFEPKPFGQFQNDYTYAPYHFQPYSYYPPTYTYNGFINMSSSEYAPPNNQQLYQNSASMSPDSSCSF